MARARDYVELAEQASGSIPQPVNFADIWGDALAECVEVSDQYRMGPGQAGGEAH
jgi:hypothetical protein